MSAPAPAVRLSVHRNTRIKRLRRACHAHLKEALRAAPHDIDGFVVLWFRREDDGDLVTQVDYACRDPADSFHLPEMARTQLLCRFAQEGGDE